MSSSLIRPDRSTAWKAPRRQTQKMCTQQAALVVCLFCFCVLPRSLSPTVFLTASLSTLFDSLVLSMVFCLSLQKSSCSSCDVLSTVEKFARLRWRRLNWLSKKSASQVRASFVASLLASLFQENRWTSCSVWARGSLFAFAHSLPVRSLCSWASKTPPLHHVHQADQINCAHQSDCPSISSFLCVVRTYVVRTLWRPNFQNLALFELLTRSELRCESHLPGGSLD